MENKGDIALMAVYAALDVLNQDRLLSEQLHKSFDTFLFGYDGLDSYGVINFVIEVEKQIEILSKKQILLVESLDILLGDKANYTVEGFVKYLAQKLKESNI